MPFIAVLASLLFYGLSFAQTSKDGERPPRPANASNARVGGWCDALTGQKKEQCLRDERRKDEKTAKEDRAQRERGPVKAVRKPRDD
ncbi:MAG TPA: hypothetical protein VJT77_09430 [Burkholderiales bacterium]|nr:hypothetical protein [Burkholderiales bacterium]